MPCCPRQTAIFQVPLRYLIVLSIPSACSLDSPPFVFLRLLCPTCSHFGGLRPSCRHISSCEAANVELVAQPPFALLCVRDDLRQLANLSWPSLYDRGGLRRPRYVSIRVSRFDGRGSISRVSILSEDLEPTVIAGSHPFHTPFQMKTGVNAPIRHCAEHLAPF